MNAIRELCPPIFRQLVQQIEPQFEQAGDEKTIQGIPVRPLKQPQGHAMQGGSAGFDIGGRPGGQTGWRCRTMRHTPQNIIINT